MALRDRCKEMYERMSRDAILRQGSPVDSLMQFVMAEKGRAADKALEETMPLILYFGSEEDREEFASLVHQIKPGMRSVKMP